MVFSIPKHIKLPDALPHPLPTEQGCEPSSKSVFIE